MKAMSAQITVLASATVIQVVSTVPLGRPDGMGYSSIIVFGDSFSDNGRSLSSAPPLRLREASAAIHLQSYLGNGSYRLSNGTWPLVPL